MLNWKCDVVWKIGVVVEMLDYVVIDYVEVLCLVVGDIGIVE